LRLALPRTTVELDALLEAASEANVPIDITSQPSLWGARIRPDNRFLTYVSSSHFENSVDEAHAANLVQADLIQTLSAIGHETIDIYFLRIRRAIEEFQINGILEALESARQEGHIRFIGLCCDGGPFAALSLWQFHDAFDVLQVPQNPFDHDAYDQLTPLARERRVGVVSSKTLDWLGDRPFETPTRAEERTTAISYLTRLSSHHPILATVRSADEILAALSVDPSCPLSPFESAELDAAVESARTATLAALK
jgi:hypothetical protein